MSVDNVPFIPRGPRHETTSKFDFHVQVERDGKLTDIDCWLIDLSRNGMKAWTGIAAAGALVLAAPLAAIIQIFLGRLEHTRPFAEAMAGRLDPLLGDD